MHPNVKDLTGQKFGYLTVLEKGADHITSSGKRMVTWVCKCKCGKITTVSASNLKSGTTTSCGCYRREMLISRRGNKMPFAEDVIGQQYGLLTIEKETDPYRDLKGGKHRMFVCKCVCGKERKVRIDLLKAGKVVSCGCISLRVYKKIKDIVKG